MLTEALTENNRFADLEEEKDLLPLRQAKDDITLDVLQVECGGHG
jgi:hypothetical protein